MRLPCGRLLTDRQYPCARKHHWWNTYWTKHEGGWWELRCLFCHHPLYKDTFNMTFWQYIFKTNFLREGK